MMIRFSPIEKEWREGDWAAMWDSLGEGRLEALYEEGKSLTYEQAVALAQNVLDR